MSTRNERLNENLISLDEFLGQFNDESKIAALSDGGKGAETMLQILDYDPKEESDEIVKENNEYVSLLIFEGMLTLCGQERLIPIVEQIVKNGKNRQESITQLSIKWRLPKQSARRKYYRGVSDLLTLISPNKI